MLFSEEMQHTLDVIVAQSMVHGQTEHPVGNLVSLRKVLAGGRGESAVSGEVGNQWVEVSASK